MRARAVCAALLCGLLGLAAALASPPAAPAFYANAGDGVDGALLVSADYARLEQGDDTTRFAAVSGDGRYVAMQTRARNFFADGDPDPPGQFRAGGIFRFDLQTRALAKVADGDLFEEAGNAFLRRGASNPSISADGRYVAFATAQRLGGADLNSSVDVYVRDMDRPAGAADAYALVSARDGGSVPASFAPPSSPIPGGDPGAEVSPGVAISADGRRVAFRTEAASDLPAQAGTTTPAGQIFVRDLAAHTTTLVTATREGDGTMATEPAGGRSAPRSAPTARPSPGPAATPVSRPGSSAARTRTRPSATTSGAGPRSAPPSRPGGSPASAIPTTRSAVSSKRRTRG